MQSAQTTQHETEVEQRRQEIEALFYRQMIDELCELENDDAELLRLAKKYVRLRNEEIEEFLEATMEGKH